MHTDAVSVKFVALVQELMDEWTHKESYQQEESILNSLLHEQKNKSKPSIFL